MSMQKGKCATSGSPLGAVSVDKVEEETGSAGEKEERQEVVVHVDPQQRVIDLLFSDPKLASDKDELAKSADITVDELKAIITTEDFSNTVKNSLLGFSMLHAPEVMASTIQMAVSGNVAAQKLFYQISSMLAPDAVQNNNFNFSSVDEMRNRLRVLNEKAKNLGVVDAEPSRKAISKDDTGS